MKDPESKILDSSNFIRERLHGEGKGEVARYAELVLGEYSLWKLIRYELITTLVGPLPGALGLLLRRSLFRPLFGSVGRGAVIGRNVTVRNGTAIRLGDRVTIDDGCVLDARGAGPGGISIGSEAILNRGAVLVAKAGPISIGERTDIGSGASVISQGGIEIGSDVSIAGHCMLGGGLLRNDPNDGADDLRTERFSKGPICLEDGVTLFQGAIVLDGVRIGRGARVGAAAVLRSDVPAGKIAAPQQRVLLFDTGSPASAFGVERQRRAPAAHAGPLEGEILEAVYAALDELNQLRAADDRIARSPESALFGPDGPLDSMDLVNFVVSTEERLSEGLGIQVDLGDAARLEDGENPFETIATLVTCIAKRCPGEDGRPT